MKQLSKLIFTTLCLSSFLLSSCGNSEAPAHHYSNEWSYNGTSHWHACIDEGYEDLKKDEANHTFVDVVTPPTYDAGGYTTHTCSVCNYSYVDSETEKLVHHYSSEWSHNETNHWHACTDEGYEDLKKDEAIHVYDDDHDAICNTCGYERSLGDHAPETIWSYDAQHHWHVCQHQGCELTFDYAKHSFDNDHDTTCECGYVRDIGDHAPKSTWSHDGTHHWHTCAHEGCELKFDYNEHTADIHGFCDTCGKYLGQDKSMSYNKFDSEYENRADFGTLAAGTYYYRINFSIYSGSLNVASSNMSSESYVFYWKNYTTGEWNQSGDTCKVGPTNTYDSFGYLVITLTSQITEVYITYYTHMSI